MAQKDILDAYKYGVITESQAEMQLSVKQGKGKSEERKRIIVCVIELFEYFDIPYKTGNRDVIKSCLSEELGVDVSVIQKRITEWKIFKEKSGYTDVIGFYHTYGIIVVAVVQKEKALRKTIFSPHTPQLEKIISNIQANLRQN